MTIDASTGQTHTMSHTMVFITGLHRSGTSLLHQCLRAHPQVSGLEATGVPEDEGQHLQSVYPPAKRFGGPGRFGFSPEAHLTEKSPLVSAASRERLFAAWAPYWDLSRQLLVEKSPPNLLQTRFLQALFPNARFVILTRHPVAVAYATQKWRKASLYSLLEHWLHCHEIFANDREHLKHVRVIRYEDFVVDADAQLREIYRWLGVEHCAPNLTIRGDVNSQYFKKWNTARRSRLASVYLDYSTTRFEDRLQRFGYSLRHLDGVEQTAGADASSAASLQQFGQPLGLAYRAAGEMRRMVWDGQKSVSRLLRIPLGRTRQRKPAVHHAAPAEGTA